MDFGIWRWIASCFAALILLGGCSQLRPLDEIMVDLNRNAVATVEQFAGGAVSGVKTGANVVELGAVLVTGPLAGIFPLPDGG